MTQAPCRGIRCYRFGPYVLDAHRSQLWRGDTLVPLAQKTVEVLTTLVEHPDISKTDLMNAVWSTTVVEENNLARHISMLRKALQERPDQHEYIVTIPGRGYRFVAEVERLGTAVEPSSSVVLRHPPSFPKVVVLPVVGVAIAAVVAIAWLASRSVPLPHTAPPVRTVRAITFGKGLAQQPSWSPDGRFLAFASDAAGNSDIWVVALADPSPTRLTTSDADEWQPAWSPDGRWIAYRSEQDGGGLFVMSATGGARRRIAPFGFRPRWSPTGALILFSGPPPNPRLYVVGLTGDEPRVLEHDTLRGVAVRAAAWLPDGERVTVSGLSAEREWRLLTISISDGRAVTSILAPDVEARLREDRIDIDTIAWSSSAEYLYFSGRSQDVSNLWRVKVDPATLELRAGPERLTTGAGSDLDPALSPEGGRLAFTVGRKLTRIWSVPLAGRRGEVAGEPVPVTSGEPGEYDAAVPADGTRLVYRTARGSRREVWERTVGDGSDRLLLVSKEWTPTSPRWSRDGTRLAFTRIGAPPARGQGGVVILSTASGAERTVPTPGFSDVVPDDWTTDGRWILASCRARKGGYRRTCLLAASSSEPPEVRVIASDSKRDLISQRFSPDGRWISFIAVDPKDRSTSTVYAMPEHGGPWVAVTSGSSFENNSRWGPDGTIYFVSNRDGSKNVWGQQFDMANGKVSGEAFKVTHFDSPARVLASNRDWNFEMSVAADRLFLPVTETSGEIWLLEHLAP